MRAAGSHRRGGGRTRSHDLARWLDGDGLQAPDPAPDRAPDPARSRAPERPRQSRTRRVAVVLELAVLLMLTAGTTVAVASQSALPGEPLYGAKVAAERVTLALNPGDDTDLLVRYARRRAAEADQRPDHARELLARSFRLLDAARGPDVQDARDDLIAASRRLLDGQLPATAPPSARRALERSERDARSPVPPVPGILDRDRPDTAPRADDPGQGASPAPGDRARPDGRPSPPGVVPTAPDLPVAPDGDTGASVPDALDDGDTSAESGAASSSDPPGPGPGGDRSGGDGAR